MFEHVVVDTHFDLILIELLEALFGQSTKPNAITFREHSMVKMMVVTRSTFFHICIAEDFGSFKGDYEDREAVEIMIHTMMKASK